MNLVATEQCHQIGWLVHVSLKDLFLTKAFEALNIVQGTIKSRVYGLLLERNAPSFLAYQGSANDIKVKLEKH